MQDQNKWHTLLAPLFEDTPYELVGVTCAGGTRHATVRVYVDKPGGISIDEVAQMSRKMSVFFDVHEPVQGKYTLEVSSPGLDRPLFTPDHFQQVIGKLITVKTRLAHEIRQNYKGHLLAANDTRFQLRLEEGDEVSFAYDDIDKAKVVYSL